jgi:hypothetical protein
MAALPESSEVIVFALTAHVHGIAPGNAVAARPSRGGVRLEVEAKLLGKPPEPFHGKTKLPTLARLSLEPRRNTRFFDLPRQRRGSIHRSGPDAAPEQKVSPSRQKQGARSS